ncbi:MAG: PKD domain-containing protein [bacterium]
MGVCAFRICFVLILSSAAAWAEERYVSLSGAHEAPFTNWVTAATDIQAAIDVSLDGDIVWVTNGVYDTGGVAGYPAVTDLLTNRVAIHKPITVRSVNGPAVTVIKGAWDPATTNGDAAVRCVYVTNGASLLGFTLTNGATRTEGSDEDQSGGGVWCEGSEGVGFNCIIVGNSAGIMGGGAYGATLQNCTLTGNSATYDGGGVYYGTLYNCTLSGNAAGYGGGVSDSTLNNCTLTGNSASYDGGGACFGTLNNCTLSGNAAGGAGGGACYSELYNGLVYYNEAPDGPNHKDSDVFNCCTVPDPGGVGNITNAPGIVSVGNPRLLEGSACLNAGSNDFVSWALDRDDEPRTNGAAVDIGSDEYWASGITGTLTAGILVDCTNVATGVAVEFQTDMEGRAQGYTWSFGDGGYATNECLVLHAFATAGVYDVVLEVSNYAVRVTATVQVVVFLESPTHYVAPGGGHMAPFTNWVTAATNIQAAIDVSSAGDTVWVTNGVYDTGGVAGYPAVTNLLTNRVAVHKAITVRSVNGPAVTVIRGAWDPATTNGDAAVRCVYMTNGASLIGLTLTNGATRSSGDIYRERSGGGLWCESVDAVVSNCVIAGNAAGAFGGGTFAGTLYDCTLVGNSAFNWGGGAEISTLYDCTLSGNSAEFGGGADNSTLYDCTLSSNSAGVGGGADDCTLANCTLSGNAADFGGGADNSALYDCTLSGNQATNWGGGVFRAILTNCTLSANGANWGGGAETSTLYNCTLSSNTATYGGGADESTLYDCTLIDNWASQWGGGVVFGTLYNCTFSGNTAGLGGGGAEYATLNNCSLFGNWADVGGGGASDGTLNNCTIMDNAAGEQGGGIWGGTLNNCIVYYNDAPRGLNYTLGVFANSCTTPDPGGIDNITNQPNLLSLRNPLLLEDSPCRNAGDNAHVSWALDRDDEPRTNGAVVDIGSDEYWASGVTGTLTATILADYTNVAAGYAVAFQTDIEGWARGYTWSFGDGGYATNECLVPHAFATAGVYDVVLDVSNYTVSVAATVTVQVVSMESATHYVAPGGGHVAPFTNWVTAATNIQAAVEVCIVGGTVWVSNGVYETGGVKGYPVEIDLLTNRVVIHEPITVRSVNGPEVTVIKGAWDPATTNGNAAVRCVYMANGAGLIGFTLTNGRRAGTTSRFGPRMEAACCARASVR